MSESRTPSAPVVRAAVALAAGAAVLLPGALPAVAGVGAVTATGSAAPPNSVVAWNAAAGRAAVAACIAPLDDPLHESRMYAMMHLAVSDALNAIDLRSTPYAYRGSAKGAAPAAAVAAASRGTLLPALRALPAPFTQACIDAGVASVESDYATAVAVVPAGEAKRRGLAVGRAAAAAMVAERAHDGSQTTLIDDTHPQGTKPGQWRFTPDRPFAFAPGWGNVTPFALDSATQVQPEAPYAVTSPEYARDVREVKRLGGNGTTTPSARTADQTQIARFWWESSPLMWNSIGRTLARDQHLDAWQSARLFGLLDAALSDGYVSSFAAKYDYSFWRPVTAIRAAGTDGNPATSADPDWTPLEITPAIPDHDSAHAVEGGAAATVLRRFFGTDRMSFSACSVTLPDGTDCDGANPARRHYKTFSQASEENALSRVLIGFHFRHAVDAGRAHGHRIGELVVSDLLRPVD